MIRPNSLYNPIKASIKKPELSRLLSAAVINSQFCNMLLNDPVTAAQEGYEDERFSFNHKEIPLSNRLCDRHVRGDGA